MSIIITVLKYPQGVMNAKASHTFDEAGGTIGRSADNQWILEDPERFISSRHSQISYENNQYFLTDLSTNGTFLNGSGDPIGKGSKIKLNTGDRFTLGDYEFQVNILGGQSGAAMSPFGDGFDDDPFGLGGDSFDTPTDPGTFGSGGGYIPASEPMFGTDPQETDPLAALDRVGLSPGTAKYEDNIWDNMTQFGGKNNDATADAIDWPTAHLSPNAGGIPEDWDDDLSAKPTGFAPQAQPVSQPVQQPIQPPPGPSSFLNNEAHRTDSNQSEQYFLEDVADQISRLESEKYTLEKHNLKLQAEIVRLKQPGAHSVTQMDDILIEALGLSGRNISKQKVAEISQTIGALVRETIVGMMQVLTSRSSIKNEFRMNVTTIQPVENNPLKFSANVDDAIENMFIREGNSYMKPIDAIREGFEGIGEHQVAILAGIRAAFRSVIQRFDPELLEQRFEKFQKGNFIPGMNKAKNWELYVQYYQDLINDMDSSFQNLFGHDFVAAYEDQLQKLSISRKTKR
ncbi:MAG: type VI secretion system-associated FHA domain protein TagH [Gammaproteobacteria bacterium]|nr:type VI secretion system-associated FHA domain protein TagH [Gammaproteobacteria bacterium]MDH5652767.1 type VI secretion system-associated FHA domain protein TagH [Gammaproteobacteria bacterium]